MSMLTDEILNKYIDGELDSLELAEVKDELGRDDKALARLQSLRTVDNSLKQMEIEPAPINFTEKVMSVILAAKKAVKPKINYFFISIVSIFSVGLVTVLIAAFFVAEKNNSKSVVTPYVEKVKEAISKNIFSIQSFLGNQSVILIISVLSLILLLTVYFTFESHKNFTKKLNSISH